MRKLVLEAGPYKFKRPLKLPIAQRACETCAGKGFVNPDGSPNNAFEGSDHDATKVCPKCKGTGKK